MELVPTRTCRHVEWLRLPGTNMQFCPSCGFCLSYEERPWTKDMTRNIYSDMQKQPKADSTFNISPAPNDEGRYQYRPLDHGQMLNFRILILEPGGFDDPLYGSLEHVNLQQYPLYDAVSYTWANQAGEDALSLKIFCKREGGYIAITENCAAALRRLRLLDRERRLWIDAICIDQSNFIERNHQVRNLTLTFRSAQQVVIYLGEGDERTQRLLEYMAKDCGGSIPDIADFVSFFQRRWFHRVWVLEEIAAAKSLTMIYGHTTRSWSYIIDQVKLFQNMMKDEAEAQLPLPPVIGYALEFCGPIQDGPLSSSKFDILSILQISRSCSCKDPRDKIYAIMDLAQNRPSIPLLPINYSPSTTVASVYIALAEFHILSTRSLKILSYVQGQSELDMPSWVPDWTKTGLPLLPGSSPSSGVVDSKSSTLPKISLSKLFASMVSRNMSLGLEVKGNESGFSKILIVHGRKVGNVWPETVIFGDKSEINDLPKISGEEPLHWLLSPSRCVRTQVCIERRAFWESFKLFLLYTSSKRLNNAKCFADIPPSFGGFCANCYHLANLQWHFATAKNSDYRNITREEAFDWALNRPKDFICICTYAQHLRAERGNTPGNKTFQQMTSESMTQLSSSHFLAQELANFKKKLLKFGRGRRLFGTEYTLGLGPENIEEGDEVWLFDGAEVPLVLRGDQGNLKQDYKLIGECYLHAALRKEDNCAICGNTTFRESVGSSKQGLLKDHARSINIW